MRRFYFLLTALFCLIVLPFAARASFFSPKAFTLDNGMPFYVIPYAKGSTLFHGIFYRVGSLDDPLGKDGLAHFFEHMMFKGKDANLIYSLGGNENAYTTYHLTAYRQSFSKEHLRTVLKREVRRMEHLPISDSDFSAEKKVILEERLQSYDNRPAALFRERSNALYYFGTPYARPVIGTKGSITSITREDMEPFFDTYYTPQNAYSVVVGNIDPSDAYKIANATLGQIALKKGAPNVRPIHSPSGFADVTLSSHDATTQYPALSMIMHGPSLTSSVKEAAAFSLLLDYLSDGENSYLQENLSRRQELVLKSDASYSGLIPFFGMAGFYFSPRDGVSADRVFDSFRALLLKLSKEGFSKERFAVHKNRLRAGQIFMKDDPSAMLHAFADYLSTGLSLEAIERIPDIYTAVTEEDVRAALLRLLATPTLKGVRLPEK